MHLIDVRPSHGKHLWSGQALPLTITEKDLARGCVYPSLHDIRHARRLNTRASIKQDLYCKPAMKLQWLGPKQSKSKC